MNYYIATDRFGNYDLAHGLEWRKHKYIRKEGNRYIYPEDLKKTKNQAQAAINKYQSMGRERTARQRAIDKQQAIVSAKYAQINGLERTKSYIARGIAAEAPGTTRENASRVANRLVELNGTNSGISAYYKDIGRNLEVGPIVEDKNRRRDQIYESILGYQERGKKRTVQYGSAGQNAVKKWGSSTLDSAKKFASKGASWVSNLLKKKK